MMQLPRFVVVSSTIPPSSTGQALVLGKLLRFFAAENYCLLSTEWHSELKLRANYHHFNSPNMALAVAEYSLARSMGLIQTSALWPLYRGLRSVYRSGKRAFNGVLVSSASRLIADRAQQIAAIVQHENCALIVGCSGELYDLPSAHRASQLTGVPFVAYILDYYAGSWTDKQGELARRLEPQIMRDAAAVLVTNEHMADIYRCQYGIEAVIIRNPCIISNSPSTEKPVSLLPADTINIVYTGAIYTAHYDAFRRLIAAIRALQRNDVKLHIFTNNPLSVLTLEGINGPEVVFHDYLPPDNIVHLQQQADILFLPLAFHSHLPEMIATSAPGKTGEYLAAGKAVLVHAPPNSFLSWYFRQHGCGAVVDREDVDLLAETLQRLIEDAAWREQLGQAARARALADFDLAVVGPRFVNALETAAGVRFT